MFGIASSMKSIVSSSYGNQKEEAKLLVSSGKATEDQYQSWKHQRYWSHTKLGFPAWLESNFPINTLIDLAETVEAEAEAAAKKAAAKKAAAAKAQEIWVEFKTPDGGVLKRKCAPEKAAETLQALKQIASSF